VGILAAFLFPRFLVTRVRTFDPELPVQALPEEVGEWKAVEAFVCAQCLKELEQAARERREPGHPETRMAYGAEEVKDNRCPVHHLPLTRTSELPISFLVKNSLPAGTLFFRKLYRKPIEANSRARDVVVTVVTSGKDKRSIHRPERCLPAQGWMLVSRDRLAFPMKRRWEASFKPTRLVLQDKEGRRGVALYWYMSRRKWTGSNLERLLRGWWDRVFEGVNYRWSYALLFSPVQETAAETTREIALFGARLALLIQRGYGGVKEGD
jgi:EpsI family protein